MKEVAVKGTALGKQPPFGINCGIHEVHSWTTLPEENFKALE